MPGFSRPARSRASSISETAHGPVSASMTAWVPHSASATRRACGYADCSPRLEAGRVQCSAFAGVSGTSRQVPSIATSRRPANQDPGVPGPAKGCATRNPENTAGTLN